MFFNTGLHYKKRHMKKSISRVKLLKVGQSYALLSAESHHFTATKITRLKIGNLNTFQIQATRIDKHRKEVFIKHSLIQGSHIYIDK